ncbi:hypothetical protein O7599_32110 [Streptomyces sp. WMMC500]|uniref:hypothetical protein n=1 Tax=Streptomyces sp. WMMC500 TaxID=3015154 RepID=UPI00248C07C0|nr:hypothetical protein [Streptomyces sp. WMMC500]WBB60132.1 hypothetical protein O7599_32110 [Streptomyces sp. WMMC500]
MNTADPALICSAKACRAPAVWVLAWNNPKLHTPERRKTWLACEEHREYLSRFLGVRDFLKEVVTLADWQEAEKRAATSADENAGTDGGGGAGGQGPERG